MTLTCDLVRAALTVGREVDLARYGYSARQITDLNVFAQQSLLPGFWLSGVSILVLLAVAVGGRPRADPPPAQAPAVGLSAR